MLNVCMLAALARWHEFEVHVRGALNNGVTVEEIAEILLHTAVYAGHPDRVRRFPPRRRGDQGRRGGEELKPQLRRIVLRRANVWWEAYAKAHRPER